MPKTPAEILAAAAPFYDFSDATLKPWHMKASYQLYNDKGQPTVTGSYEYWWANPNTYRSTLNRPGLNGGEPVESTDWHVDGKHYYRGSGTGTEFFEDKLESDLLTPLPDKEDLDPAKATLVLHEQQLGGGKVPCVMISPKMSRAPLGLFPTYCFDPDRPILIAHFSYGAASVAYNRISLTQGKFIAREFVIFDGQKKVLSATVDVVDGITATDPALTLPKEAVQEVSRTNLSSEVVAGKLLSPIRPTYPSQAKDAHIQGTVHLQVLIGTDGRVHEIKVIDGPSPSLIASAIAATSEAKYSPFKLNGGSKWIPPST